MKGVDSLTSNQKISENQFNREFESYLFKQFERQRCIEYTSQLKPTLLPIPFPRFFTPNILNEQGLVKAGELGREDFVSTVPTLTRTVYDGYQYFDQAEKALSTLRMIKPQVRNQLVKEQLIEEDDLRGEVRERDQRDQWRV